MYEQVKQIEAKVKECSGPKSAATVLVNGLCDQLDALTQDPIAIAELSKQLRAGADPLSNAFAEVATAAPKATPTASSKTAAHAPSHTKGHGK